jgi:hypothetical protein
MRSASLIVVLLFATGCSGFGCFRKKAADCETLNPTLFQKLGFGRRAVIRPAAPVTIESRVMPEAGPSVQP